MKRSDVKRIKLKLVRREIATSPAWRLEVHPADEDVPAILRLFRELESGSLHRLSVEGVCGTEKIDLMFDDSGWSRFAPAASGPGIIFLNSFHIEMAMAFIEKYLREGPSYPPFIEIPVMISDKEHGEINSYLVIYVARAGKAPKSNILEMFDLSDQDKLH